MEFYLLTFNVNSLKHFSLCYIERLTVGAAEHKSFTQHNVLVGDNVIEECAVAYYGILHENTVLYRSVSADLYAAEYDGIFNCSLDIRAVRYH